MCKSFGILTTSDQNAIDQRFIQYNARHWTDINYCNYRVPDYSRRMGTIWGGAFRMDLWLWPSVRGSVRHAKLVLFYFRLRPKHSSSGGGYACYSLHCRLPCLTYFGLLWPSPLTSRFAAESVHSFSKYRVHKFGNRRTNGRVENTVPHDSLYLQRHRKLEEVKWRIIHKKRNVK